MGNTCSIIIDLYRHGKVDGAPALYGQTDIACTDKGHAKLLECLNASAAPDIVLTSPLKRCAYTAQCFAEKNNIPLKTLPFLQEMNFGNWDGVPFERLTEEQAELEKFWNNPADYPPPRGETLDHFWNRVNLFWSNLEAYSAAAKVSVIAHGGVIRMLLAQALELDYKNPNLFTALSIDNASKSRIEIYRDGTSTFRSVKFINQTSTDEKTP